MSVISIVCMVFSPLSVRRLEVIEGADDFVNCHGIADVGDDLLHRFVREGSLINGGFVHRRGIDALHSLLVLGQGNALLGLTAAHQPPRAVGRRPVPVGVALTGAEQASVTHIDGD